MILLLCINQLLAQHHRTLQNSLLCVYNESGLRLALSNPSRYEIQLCTFYISIDARVPNAYGYQGILIANKKLEIYCVMSGGCVIDAQNLSRMFHVFNSTLYIQNTMFMNSNASKDSNYGGGGALYVQKSTIEMRHCSFINNIANGGGMIIFQSNVTMMHNDTLTSPLMIQNNKAVAAGGFLYAIGSMIHFQKLNFINNSAENGGTIYMLNSSLTLFGNNNDTSSNESRNNQASSLGGFLYAYNSNIKVHNKFNYINNTARYGGVFYLDYYSKLTILGSADNNDTTLPNECRNNKASVDGGFLFAHNSSIEIQKLNYVNNSAEYYGGVFYLYFSNLMILRSDNDTSSPNESRNNIASADGGFLYAYTSTINVQKLNYINNSAVNDGGAFYLYVTTLTLLGSDNDTLPNESRNNKASADGGFLFAYNSTIEIHKFNYIKNSAVNGGVMNIINTMLKIYGTDNIIRSVSRIESNKAIINGGFISSSDSNIEIYKHNFINNSAQYGGAFSITNSILTIIGKDDNDTI